MEDGVSLHSLGGCSYSIDLGKLVFLRVKLQAFTERQGLCFSLRSRQCAGGSDPSRAVLSIVVVLWGPGMPAPLASMARWSWGVPCLDCTLPGCSEATGE